MRRVFDDRSIDAVCFATPNHWHALGTIWACQAGKDVYVEKPVSHNVSEGRRIVEAARKYKKIVQTGTQCRSSSGIREAVEWVQAGNLGKIKISRGLCYKPRMSIGKVSGPQPIPANIDYDLWCGPAAKLPLMRAKLHYDWHWVWNTGNGDLGNQGIHQMDIARWFLGVNEVSPRVFSVGGRLGYIDDGETANTQFIYHAYARAPLIFEVRGLPRGKDFHGPNDWTKNMDSYKGAGIGVVVECEHGYVVVPNYNSATAYDQNGAVLKKFEGATSHHGNFLEAVRSRKFTDLHADILEGHLSSALCHTGNISYRLGQRIVPGEIRDRIKDDKDAVETFERMAGHMAANGVDIADEKLTLGMPLKMHPAKETFVGNHPADLMLTREYRAGFVVPEKV
jgi:predicted dehydrogenase